MTAGPAKEDCGGERAGRCARASGSAPTAPAAREIRIHGCGGALIREGWQVAGDGGQTAWITGAGAIAVSGQPLYPGEPTEAGPLWPSGNFAAVKDKGLPFTTVHG